MLETKLQRPGQAGMQESSQCLDHSRRTDNGRQSRWWRMNSEHFQQAANLALIAHDDPLQLPSVCIGGTPSGGEHQHHDAGSGDRGAAGTGGCEGHAVLLTNECIDRSGYHIGRLGQHELNEAAVRRGSGARRL